MPGTCSNDHWKKTNTCLCHLKWERKTCKLRLRIFTSGTLSSIHLILASVFVEHSRLWKIRYIYIYTYYIILYIYIIVMKIIITMIIVRLYNMYMCVCCNMFQTLRSCFMFWAELLHRWKISGDWKPCFRSLFPLQQALCENKAMQLAKLSAVRPKLSTKASLPLNGKFAKHLISRSQLEKSWPRIQGKTIETDENVHEVRYPLSLTFIHFPSLQKSSESS